ncbi:3-coathanger stack domain-containing protein [Emticicia sp. BO119]|uniref:3-coathanger stack domain-containing protein n=1 Tax=Emticicia sp. BO119 TaxID=2757768 RepID=UPI0015F10172|nr:3-coathanger stack domain-containing protein [Emticicia sp. BO119]MBA4853983.1 proprotein convertase P-domain-containing protein [Emticicia sp. BO119]
MKKCTLLSLLCVFVIHITLAKVGMPCDNTQVLKNQKFLPPTKQSKKSASLLNPLSAQQVLQPSSTLALTSTMVSKDEIEPNNEVVTAMPLGGNDVKVKGFINPNGDNDYYSFTANAGERVYVATQTAFSASGSTDSILDVLSSDGFTVLETDDNDGTFGANSSSIAGTPILVTGTYYIRVKHLSSSIKLLPYFLYFRLQSGSPTAEIEPNNGTSVANVFPNSGWVNGSLSSDQDSDYYSISLNAGDTIFISLDFNPERDGTTWNGQVALGEFSFFYLPAGDPNTQSPNSEALFLTVKTSGTYYIVVAPDGNTFGTYQLSASVLPANTANLSSYNSTDTTDIPSITGSITSNINVPVNKRIESLKVSINLFHSKIEDLDVRLTSPSGNTVILFTDIVAASPMDIKLDDAAAIPMGSFPIVSNIVYQPPKEYRLEWFKGQLAQGNWTLTIDIDSPGSSGTLNSWAIEIEEQAPVLGTLTSIYTNDFETSDGGFIHSGAQDEWERGTPAFAPITTANGGTKCWKTDLDNTYNFNTNCDLISPNIYIPDLGVNNAYLTWTQKYQFAGTDGANTNAYAYVEIQEIGTANRKKVWEWLGPKMIGSVGSPSTSINESAGWGLFRVKINEFASKTIRVIFHFESDASSPLLAGWAVDDVNIFKTFCPNNLTLTDTDNYSGVYSRAVASGSITASNEITTNTVIQNPSNLTYQATNSIILLPNFKADATGGTVFTAQIGGCN